VPVDEAKLNDTNLNKIVESQAKEGQLWHM
jgi:hypothetical protein